MSPLAKVFVCINLLLAVFFTGIVSTLFTARNDYKTQITQMSDDHTAIVQTWNDHKSALQANLNAQAEALAGLRQEVVKKDEQLATTRTENTALKTEIAEHKASIENSNTRIDELTKNENILQEDIRTRDDQLREARDLANSALDAKKHAELVAARQKLEKEEIDKAHQDLQKLFTDITHERDGLAAMTKRFQERYPELYAAVTVEAPPLPVDGQICAVQDDVVVLTVGQDDNVHEGMTFTVFRRDRLVGKVRVTKVAADLSGAEILWLNDGQAIEVGDNASTVLN